MILEKRSVVSEPIVHDGPITLVNLDGDLIIDAPIVSKNGGITLLAKNIYCTAKALIRTECKDASKDNVLIQTTEQLYSSATPFACNINVNVGTDVCIGKKDYKSELCNSIRLFDKNKLKKQMVLAGAEMKEIKEVKQESKVSKPA